MALFKWVTWIFTFHLFVSKPISSNASLSPHELAQIPKNFLESAKKPEIKDWMVGIRRKIHENPELGFEEFETSNLVRDELDQMGIPYKYPVAVTGVVGYIGTGGPPHVRLRGDVEPERPQPVEDVLQVHIEEGNTERVLQVGSQLGEAEKGELITFLRDNKDVFAWSTEEVSGIIVLVFQPAEEGGGGAKKMLDAGVLENVDAIFGLHVSSKYPIGAVAASPGAILAGSGLFEAVISGKGGHAAIPQHTIDPILAASNVIVSLQHLVSREADPLDSQVVTVAKFQGGGAFNVIPDSVTIGGTFRAFSKESFFQLKQRIEEVIKKQASVQRCNATVIFNANDRPFYPVTVNNKNLHKHFQNVAGGMLGVQNIKDFKPVMGAEDFSFFAEAIPGYFFYVGMKEETKGQFESGHSPYFRVNEDILPYGAALHASLATRYLLENPLKSTLPKGSHHDEL
ncbi:Peptidase_M20 domain-containing protein/M20_dimer domain-containing protein [Cephalotus follicularis]|uniref:Peptidase_M20 domain-containing protein/M20_dimer domain-containing protein n=1 Tax=Cephalotus follicularis TaxID=3775 RepID=A0A1Q3B2Q3_CEPFO|nr:Peptidase_M20 domain-containing protein/M20_dimer domain-containing protein [Cephalotus follicularis]